jgi:hypothetical protein
MKKEKKMIFSMWLYLMITSFIACNTTPNRKVLDNFRDVRPKEIESNIEEFPVSESNPAKIVIQAFDEHIKLKLSDVFDTVTFVKLSNDPDALVGDINKISIHNNCIYVLDRYKTKSLKKFAMNGDFITAIGKRGEGPEEYVESTDFIVFNDEVIVCDQFKSDLKYYDLDGRFKYRKKAPFLFLKFSCFSPNQYVFQTVDADNDHLQSIVNYSIFQSDSSFVLNHRGFYRPKGLYISFISENNFFPYKDKIFFHPAFTDTIFSIRADNRIEAEYIIDFQKKKLPMEAVEQKHGRELKALLKTDKYATFAGNYVLTDDYLYFEYDIKNRRYRGIYSRKTNKCIIGNYFINDINMVLQFNNVLTSMDDNILVGYIQSHLIGDITENYLKNHSREDLVKDIGEEYTRIVEGIKSENNPIILFYKIKEF